MDNNYDFPVELQPILLTNGSVIPDRKAVVRTDTMDALGVVSDEYELVKHSTVIDVFRACGEKYGVRDGISLTNNGGNMFYKMSFPKVQGEVKLGDVIQLQMIAKNSYNGTHALQVVFGALRLVCTNGMVMPSALFQFSFKHIGYMGGINDRSMNEYYERMYDRHVQMFTERMPVLTEMARRNAIDAEIVFDPKEVKLPQYLLDAAKLEYHSQSDRTVWGYYNALTYAISHRMRSENPDRMIEYGKVAWASAEGMLHA